MLGADNSSLLGGGGCSLKDVSQFPQPLPSRRQCYQPHSCGNLDHCLGVQNHRFSCREELLQRTWKQKFHYCIHHWNSSPGNYLRHREHFLWQEPLCPEKNYIQQYKKLTFFLRSLFEKLRNKNEGKLITVYKIKNRRHNSEKRWL